MTQRLPVMRTVLVLGETPEAQRATEGLTAHGYQVLRPVGPNAQVESSERVTALKGRTLSALDGHVGRFQAVLAGGGARSEVECASVVVATGSERYYPAKRYGVALGPRVQTVAQMAEQAARRDRPASWRRAQRIALLLDWGGESARETAAEALALAVQLRHNWHAEVWCLYQNLKVDTYNVERLTRDMRECGVVFCRYDAVQVTVGEDAVEIAYVEGAVRVDTLVLPEAVRPATETGQVARALRIHVGADGYLQDVNIHHYRPGISSRRGVFLCGRCHIDADAQQLAEDVAQAVANVDALLGSGEIESEDVIAHVDQNECIRCLTCVRTCPHAAAEIAEYAAGEGGWAVTAACVDVWACKGCGACAANCPVKAIEMVHADEAPVRVLPVCAEERAKA
ncbi:MAG: 4Fe-4S binding protein [Chloroflexi bacterium]|nr:4Fe-4S binding protein [Chloroflexota bacterium]